MPTKDEMYELLDNCTWTWTTQDGKNGYEVKSKTNGNAIFLPAAGFREGSEFDSAGSLGIYWSSSLNELNSHSASPIKFDSGEKGWYYFGRYRYYGYPIRPVHP